MARSHVANRSTFVLVATGLLLISYGSNAILGWIMSSAEGVERNLWTGPLVLFAIPFAIGAIPAGVCTLVFSYLLGLSPGTSGVPGIDSALEIGIILFLCVVFSSSAVRLTDAPIGHWLATALSYFVRPTPTDKPFEKKPTLDPETIKDETERQQKAADLNEAIREMKRAKARMEEFKRQNRQ